MQSRDSRVEYARRMNRVVDYIDQHLDEDLTLVVLAGVAHFSPYHFHRLFLAWMGETVGDYTRRRRLEVAATRLTAQPRVPVIDIALSVGFGSTEAFAHAFRSRFGVSATAWRARPRIRNPDQASSKPDQASVGPDADDRDLTDLEESNMDVQIIDRQPVPIVYLRYVGPYGRQLAEFWGTRVMPWMASRGLKNRAMYGIAHDDPDVTAPGQCRYDVGVEVAGDFKAIGDEYRMTVPGGRYATTRFFGTPDRIQEPWQWMLRTWLPASGMQLDSRPTFEYYGPDMRFDATTGAFECDVTIPVVRL